MPVQCHEGGGLGYPEAFGCGLGECTRPGPQDGLAAGRPGDLVRLGLKSGVGVGWPETRAGLAERRGPGAGWPPYRSAECPADAVPGLTDRSGPELGGAGAATVTCASC
jgi:hypothetical protein